MKTYEEQQTLVSQLNVMDDLFFQKMVEDMDVCEEMLRILLTMPALKMAQTQPQRFIRNVDAHSVVLDLLCEDENGNIITVEVQKTDNDDHQKRMRYNLANIDTTFVEKGIKYADLPDIYAIFISPFDLFRANCTAYHVNRCLLETGDIVNNGIHELYVNAAVNDGSDIVDLMQYFMNGNVQEIVVGRCDHTPPLTLPSVLPYNIFQIIQKIILQIISLQGKLYRGFQKAQLVPHIMTAAFERIGQHLFF